MDASTTQSVARITLPLPLAPARRAHAPVVCLSVERVHRRPLPVELAFPVRLINLQNEQPILVRRYF